MLRLARVLALALVVAACSSGDQPPSVESSTLRATFVDRNGDGVLERGPGEPLVDRTELGRRAKPEDQLAFFVQIADPHVTDEESPARVEMLDRLGPPFTSAFRPQEALTGQVLAATVASVNRLRPEAVLVTGDIVDNVQANELAQALAVLRGGRVDPSSGSRAYEGVQTAGNPDPFFYRPDVDPPRRPRLLEAANRPFDSPGLRAPWYPLIGNHDVLVQGNVAPSGRTRSIATGSRKAISLDDTAIEAAQKRPLEVDVIDDLLAGGLPGESVPVTADPERRESTPAAVLGRLRAESGHGGSGPLLDYAFDLGPKVRVIVLDTVRRDLGAGGLLRPRQSEWVRRQLAAAGDRWVLVFSSHPLPLTEGGEGVLALLDGDRQVVAAISGDTHTNSIVPRRTSAGGYWLITTSSLIDYPQQARAFRLLSTAGKGVVLETWMLDHDPDVDLARTSRELAFLDYQGGRPLERAGERSDRNARLFH